MANQRKSTAMLILIPLVVVSLLMAVYAGAYCCLLADDGAVHWDLTGSAPPTLAPNYRYGGELSATLFAPVHQLDKRLRPERWNAMRYVSP